MGLMWGPTIPGMERHPSQWDVPCPSYASFRKMPKGLAHQKPLVVEEMEGRAPIPLLFHPLTPSGAT